MERGRFEAPVRSYACLGKKALFGTLSGEGFSLRSLYYKKTFFRAPVSPPLSGPFWPP